MPTILAVDDRPDNLVALSAILRSMMPECRVVTELSGRRAVDTAHKILPDVILLDVQMPEMDGYEVCRRLKEADSPVARTPVIMVTAVDTETRHKVKGLDSGADAFLTKPIDEVELVAQVKVALRMKSAEEALVRDRDNLEARVQQRNLELQQALERMQELLEGTIRTISAAVEARDPYTAGHQRRVTQLACALVREMGLDRDTLERVFISASIHDIGKISVPSEILAKPGMLMRSEMAIVRTHAEVGHHILQAIPFHWPLADIVLQHHERLDGSGYPKGLKGEEIHMESRILAVADVVEAMSSHRPYRPALGEQAALQEIVANRGKLYDEPVVAAAVSLFDKGSFAFDQGLADVRSIFLSPRPSPTRE